MSSPRRLTQLAHPAILAALATLGVLLQLILSLQLARSSGKSLLDGLIVYLGYFTILTNMLVGAVAFAGVFAPQRRLYSANMVGCATTAILVVGAVYHLLLREIWSPQGAQKLADLLLHYAVPVGALLHWLFYYRPRQPLSAAAPFLWCLYPLTYLGYVLIRGIALGSYPYPFIDVSVLGYPRVLANALGLSVLFLGAGFLVFAVGRLTSRQRPALS